jgi:uncharacterized coiled-coil protein SlyX
MSATFFQETRINTLDNLVTFQLQRIHTLEDQLTTSYTDYIEFGHQNLALIEENNRLRQIIENINNLPVACDASTSSQTPLFTYPIVKISAYQPAT